MSQNLLVPSLKALRDGITTANGLLYRNGKRIDLPEADSVAIHYGFDCAEHLVREMEKGNVYVDEPIWQFGGMLMCHMLADTEQALHEMAARLGVGLIHFLHQGKAQYPHYDISKSKRSMAIRFGALTLNREQFVRLARAQAYTPKKL